MKIIAEHFERNEQFTGIRETLPNLYAQLLSKFKTQKMQLIEFKTKAHYWETQFNKFNRWAAKNKLMMIFRMLVNEPDVEWEFIDGSIVKAHQHSAGAASEEEQGISKWVAGNTTKIGLVA